MTEFCHRAEVPRDTLRDIKVTPSCSTNIKRIEDEYTREEANERRAAPAYISLEVDVGYTSRGIIAYLGPWAKRYFCNLYFSIGTGHLYLILVSQDYSNDDPENRKSIIFNRYEGESIREIHSMDD